MRCHDADYTNRGRWVIGSAIFSAFRRPRNASKVPRISLPPGPDPDAKRKLIAEEQTSHMRNFTTVEGVLGAVYGEKSEDEYSNSGSAFAFFMMTVINFLFFFFFRSSKSGRSRAWFTRVSAKPCRRGRPGPRTRGGRDPRSGSRVELPHETHWTRAHHVLAENGIYFRAQRRTANREQSADVSSDSFFARAPANSRRKNDYSRTAFIAVVRLSVFVYRLIINGVRKSSKTPQRCRRRRPSFRSRPSTVDNLARRLIAKTFVSLAVRVRFSPSRSNAGETLFVARHALEPRERRYSDVRRFRFRFRCFFARTRRCRYGRKKPIFSSREIRRSHARRRVVQKLSSRIKNANSMKSYAI